VRKTSWLLSALTICWFGSAAHAQTGDEASAFVGLAASGATVRVIPTTDVLESRHGKKPSLALPTNTATVYPGGGSGNLIAHGGPEIGNAGFQAIYYDSSVANSISTSNGYLTIQKQIDAFTSAFADNTNWDNSSTDDYTIIQQYGTTTPIANSLKLNPLNGGAALVDTKGAPAIVTDTDIRNYLVSLLSTGKLPVNSNTVYGVFFAAGTSVQLSSTQASCTAFCAYHSGFYYNNQAIIYAVFPYPNCGGCNPWNYAAADMLTMFVGHEVRESVTDAYGAWYDASGEEADDKCAWSNLYRTANGNFFVQPEFSNGGTVTASGFTATYPGPGCIVPSASCNAPPAPTGLTAKAGNAQVSLNWTAVSGATSYKVKRGTSSGGEVVLTTVSTNSFTDTPLNNGSTYFYVVSAVGSCSSNPESTNSSEVSATPTQPPADFTISSTSPSTVTPPASATFTVTIAPLNGFTGTVGFTVTGVPSGAAASFSPSTVTTSGPTILTITTTTAVLAGTYPLTITGTSGTLKHTAAASLVISPIPASGFTLSNSGNITITRSHSGSGSGTSKITVTRVGNYGGSAALSVSGLPGQASQSLNPTSVSLASSSTGSSTLTISVNKKTPAGTSLITVTGTGSGAPSATTTLSLTVK